MTFSKISFQLMHKGNAMKSSLLPGSAQIEKSQYEYIWHLRFLVGIPERVLALRLAMSRVIKPTSIVLDAGCGPLGVLAIIAAKAGASRVIAVDTADLDLARKLAEENGVADRIDFIQGNLHETPLPVESFDIMIGMIYKNEIKLDMPRQNLMRALGMRHARVDTVFIPNKVRYSVTGLYCPGGDIDPAKSRVEAEKNIETAERYTGITFSACRELIEQARQPSRNSDTQIRGLSINRLGHLKRSNMTLLTERKLFTEICYNDRLDLSTYPNICCLPVTHSGRLNTVIWQQDLIFDDILIRTTESINLVTPTPIVEPGMIINIHTGQDWGDKVPITIDGKV
jgi:hypothetical protein